MKRVFQGWKVAHTINSSTFTARNPISSGRRAFFWCFSGSRVETTRTKRTNRAMCNLGLLVSGLTFLLFRQHNVGFSSSVACLVPLQTSNTNFKQRSARALHPEAFTSSSHFTKYPLTHKSPINFYSRVYADCALPNLPVRDRKRISSAEYPG